MIGNIETKDTINLYVIATECYSIEGIEGVVGYDPLMSYTMLDLAKRAAETLANDDAYKAQVEQARRDYDERQKEYKRLCDEQTRINHDQVALKEKENRRMLRELYDHQLNELWEASNE